MQVLLHDGWVASLSVYLAMYIILRAGGQVLCLLAGRGGYDRACGGE